MVLISKQIHYLAQKYGGKEAQAIMIARGKVQAMRKLGIAVFSPILHTHYYSQGCTSWEEIFYDMLMDKYVGGQKEWHIGDFAILEMSAKAAWGKGFNTTEDWVGWDLQICEGWLNHDSKLICPECGNKELECLCGNGGSYGCYCGWNALLRYNDEYWVELERTADGSWDESKRFLVKRTYDSGLIMDFTEDTHYYDENGVLFWLDKGAQKEYNWAKRNFVKCVKVDGILKGVETEI